MACARECASWQVRIFLESTAGHPLAASDSKLCSPTSQDWTGTHSRTSKRTSHKMVRRGCKTMKKIHGRALPGILCQCAPDWFGKVEEAKRHTCSKPRDCLDLLCSRRQTVKLLSGLLAAVSWSAGAPKDAAAFPGPSDRREEEPQVFFKTPSGTKVQELLEGNGPAAQAGDTVSFHYVCRRSNGYYVYSTVDADNMPATLPLGQGQVIQGLEEVLTGMRPGGKRRALIPPSAGYVNQTLEPIPSGFGPQRSLYSHAKEPLVFEVLLLKVKQ